MLRRSAVAKFAALAILAACAGGDRIPAPAEAPITGTWNLRRVGGRPLPVVLAFNATGVVSLVAGSLEFRSGSAFRYTETWHTSRSDGSVLATSSGFQGTYTRSGEELTLTDESSGDVHQITIGADALALRRFSGVYLFTR